MRKLMWVSGLALAVASAAELGGCAAPATPTTLPADSQVTVTPNKRRETMPQTNRVPDLEAQLARMDMEKRNGGAATNPVDATDIKPVSNTPSFVPTHVASPTAVHVQGIPSIGEAPGDTTAPASQPAAAMGAANIDDAAAVAPVVAESTEPAATQAAATQMSSAPAILASASTMPAEVTLDAAMDVVRKHAAEHPTLANQLGIALLEAADGKPSEASSAALAPADKQLFSDLLAGVQSMSASTATNISDRAQPLVVLAKKWEDAADLTLPKLALASRVDSFGVFTPVDAKFVQGQKHTVIIYCEVANFLPKPIDGVAGFETHLTQQETLITDDKLLVWRPNPEDVVDHSLNQRHDFYLVKKLTIPDNLAVGKYSLIMTVTDVNSGKVSSKSIPMEITDK